MNTPETLPDLIFDTDNFKRQTGLIGQDEDTLVQFDTSPSESAIQKLVPLFTLVPDKNIGLRTATKDFSFDNPPMEPRAFALRLYETMRQWRGIGLAANQVGQPYSVFVVGIDKEREIFFNPKITEYSVSKYLDKEGCLTYPLLYLRIERPTWIAVSWMDFDGKQKEARFEGLTARCIQHEYDHLQGILFTDKVQKFALQMAKERQRKEWKRVTRRLAAAKKAEAQKPKQPKATGPVMHVSIPPAAPAVILERTEHDTQTKINDLGENLVGLTFIKSENVEGDAKSPDLVIDTDNKSDGRK